MATTTGNFRLQFIPHYYNYSLGLPDISNTGLSVENGPLPRLQAYKASSSVSLILLFELHPAQHSCSI